ISRLAPAFKTRTPDTPVVLITLNDTLAAGDAARRSGTLVAGSSTSGSTERREDRLQLQDIFSLIKKSHSLKFGLDVQRVSSRYADLADKTGIFNFASAGDFLSGVPSRFRQNFQTVSARQSLQRLFYPGRLASFATAPLQLWFALRAGEHY